MVVKAIAAATNTTMTLKCPSPSILQLTERVAGAKTKDARTKERKQGHPLATLDIIRTTPYFVLHAHSKRKFSM